MQFENQFEVAAPQDQVWETVLDVERVAPAVPGAQVFEHEGDVYKVGIKVRVGPMSMTYRGDMEIVERDDEAHRAVMKVRMKESRGQGTADATATIGLSGDNGTTSATVTTEVEMSGRVAAMGQGVLQDVSKRLVDTFAQNLATMLEGGEEAAPAEPAAPPPAGGPAPAPEGEPRGAAPPPPKPRPAPPGEEALDLGSLGGAVLGDQLKDPRKLAGLLAVVALIAFLLGRRSAR